MTMSKNEKHHANTSHVVQYRPFSSSKDMAVQNFDFTRQTTDITHFAIVFHYYVISY